MATKAENISNPESCWNKAAPNEPLFILRSTDSVAPDIVRQWASEYKDRKQRDGEYGKKQREKYLSALKCAEDMEEFYND